MKGCLTSYVDLFGREFADGNRVERIEIPLIQRDYAQGRRSPHVEDIRRDFLRVLLDAVAGGDPVGLDFVYGRIDAGTFRPLDGQQRLTTLFLLHWYVASACGRLDAAAPWTRFSYATRPSARLFCERLVEYPLPEGRQKPSDWIIDQPWYQYVWQSDPTIASCLVMIDDIHDAVRHRYSELDMAEAWRRLTAVGDPAISFYLLPLEDMDSDEELYIKMNSRGKPLTAFENFKARFEADIGPSERAGGFSHKIDGEWADLFWDYDDGDHIIDDELMRYLDFVTEICEMRDGGYPRGPTERRRLGPRAKAVFGKENPRAAEHLDFLFHAFDTWDDSSDIADTFHRLFAVEGPGSPEGDPTRTVEHGVDVVEATPDGYDPGGYDPTAVVRLFDTNTPDLFARCVASFGAVQGKRRVFSLRQSLLLYAVLIHRTEESADFPRRVRMLRNLAEGSSSDVERSAMPTLLADVDALIVHGDLDAVTEFSPSQVADEKVKAEFLQANPELRDSLHRLEDHALLQGNLGAFELDAATFRDRAVAFENAFADPDHWIELTGALLATGDYQRQPRRTNRWLFGTGVAGYDANWRELLTGATREALGPTREMLGRFLDGLARSSGTVAEHCNDVMRAWLADREKDHWFDWRYYLVKYPAMRSGATGIYYGAGHWDKATWGEIELGYRMCMMRTIYLDGHHRDPILYQMWLSAGVSESRVEDPWCRGETPESHWLRLVDSGGALRSVERGFQIDVPHDESRAERFREICAEHGDITMYDDVPVVTVAQDDDEGRAIDAEDRVRIGAELLKDLLAAGL